MSRRALIGVPALAAGAVYLNTLGAEFVFDDRSQILFNPWVRELHNFWLAVSRPVWAFKVSYATNYFRPLQMGSYNLLWFLSGGSAVAFHAANVLAHVLATALFAVLALELSRNRTVAFGAALLFAVHPIHTEAVAWVACLPELALAVFSLAALALDARSWRAAPRLGARFRAASWLSCALAMASKETAVVLPVLVFALELSCGPRRGRVGHAARRALPSALVAAGWYLVVRRVVVGGLAYAQGGATPWEALWTAPRLALLYAAKIVWPAPLAAYYVIEPVRSPAAVGFVGPALAVILGLAALGWAVRRRGDLAFAATLAVVPLLPALAVPAVGVTFFSERYAYLSSAGAVWLAAAAAAALADTWAGRPAAARWALAIIVALALGGAAASVARNRVWANDETLATTTLAREPRARAMWGLLASWQGAHGRIEEALETYRAALERFPGDVALEVDELNVRYLLHRISADEYARELEARILRDPMSYEAYFHLGTAQTRAGNHAAAERAFRNAIRLNPSFKAAYDGLTGALLAQGEGTDSVTGLAAQSGFSLGGAEDDLLQGAARLRAGDLDGAETLYRQVLDEDPRSARAWLALAVVASRRGDPAAAAASCRRALEADPEFVDAWQQLGVSELADGDAAAAIVALETAVRIDPHDKEVYNRLGVAYAVDGRRDEAAAAWRAALEIDPSFEKARKNLARLDELP